MKSLKKFLKESMPVVFGVLFALLLNNWKENLDSKKYVEQYYAHINDECTINIEKLQTLIEEHDHLSDLLESWEESDTTFEEILDGVGGLHLVLLQNTSWKYFQSSSIGKVNFEVISALSDMERMEFYYDKTADRLIDITLKTIHSKKSEDKRDILRNLEELTEKEHTLISIFENYTEWYKSHQD